jgi:putative NIF3 family GTP cyclohydrolase 1 type 2
MNTQDILNLALEMAGLKEAPADSGIIVSSDDVKKMMFGVDIETADLLLAQKLGCDLVLAHHPTSGSPAVSLHKVMERQVELMMRVGIPVNKAQKVLRERIQSNERGSHARNYDKVGNAARLLNMPLMNIHMPIDIISENTVQKHLDSHLGPMSKVGDVVDALKQLPEFAGEPAGPVIRCGAKDDYAGKVFVSMAGGTNGGPGVMKAYFEAGVGTLVMMHIPEDSLKAVKEQGIGNVVIAGHMRSDSVGINLFTKALEARGIQVIRMGGIVA